MSVPTKTDDIRTRAAIRKEAARMLMMETAKPKLAYMKNVLSIIETAPYSEETATTQAEAHAFFNNKIEELELDVAGKPRYLYTLSIAEDNGDEVTHNSEKFNTSQKVYDYIYNMTMTEDAKEMYDYATDSYNVPSAAEIDAIMDNAKYSSKNIFSVGDESSAFIAFTLHRRQVNY
jgi:hypothetical protein